MEIAVRTLIIMIILIIIAAIAILITVYYSRSSQGTVGTVQGIFPKLWPVRIQ